MAVYLHELRLELNTALNSISEAQRRKDAQELSEFMTVVSGHVQALDTAFFSAHEMSVLSALPGNVAEKTYVAIACIRSVQDSLKRRLSIVSDGHPEGHVLVAHWKTQLIWAHGLIKEAQTVYANHGQIRIIQPPG
ncbi:hypothetical protein D3C71_1674830 [compost metagenome]